MLSPTASSLFGPVLPLFSHPALVFDADLTSSDVASDFFSILYRRLMIRCDVNDANMILCRSPWKPADLV